MRCISEVIGHDACVVANVDIGGLVDVQMGTPNYIHHVYVSSLVVIPVKCRLWVGFGEALQCARRTNLKFSVFQLSDIFWRI